MLKGKSTMVIRSICPDWLLMQLVGKQIGGCAVKEGITAEAKEMLSKKHPSQRFATPEQMGARVAFLCNDAGSSITGITLPVDGGWPAQ